MRIPAHAHVVSSSESTLEGFFSNLNTMEGNMRLRIVSLARLSRGERVWCNSYKLLVQLVWLYPKWRDVNKVGVKCRLHSTTVTLLIKANALLNHVEDSCFRERKGDWL